MVHQYVIKSVVMWLQMLVVSMLMCVCVLHCSGVEWIRECITGHVTCWTNSY